MDFWTAYLIMAALSTAYLASIDPIPRIHGLLYDIVLYLVMGLLWPLTWMAGLLIYLASNNRRD